MKILFFSYRHINKIINILFAITVAYLSYLSYPAVQELFSVLYKNKDWEALNVIAVIFILILIIGYTLMCIALKTFIYVLIKIRCQFVKSGSSILFNGKRAVYHIGNENAIAKLFSKTEEEKIVAVANRHTSGVLFVYMNPGRHHNIIELAYYYFANHESNHEQGFITSNGKFVDRYIAKKIAVKANQLLPDASKGMKLFSECVW